MRTTRCLLAVATAILLIGCLSSLCQAVQLASKLQVTNPLKGFMNYRLNDGSSNLFPTTMEYSYFSMKELTPSSGVYNFTNIQKFKQEANARGNHIVFRVYLDYPNCCPDGVYSTGVPSYLTTGTNPVTFTSYTDYGGGQCPDYTNVRLLNEVKGMIKELGKEFDGDSGVAAIMAGFLGFWGEWHTYPHDELFPSLIIQNDIFKSFSNAFNTTPVVVSADSLQYFSTASESYLQNNDIGWHDDNFCSATYKENSNVDWYFYNRLVDRNLNNNWKKVVIGGEVQPDIQNQLFDSSKTCADCQPFIPAVQATHASWLLFYNIFQSGLASKPSVVAAAKEGAAVMGYGIHVPEVQLGNCTTGGNCTAVSVSVRNIGVAPFYYPLQLKAKINSGSWVTLTSSLGSLLPSTTNTVFQSEIQFTPLVSSNNTLTLSLNSPHVLSNQQLLFSNEQLNSEGHIELSFAMDSEGPHTPQTSQSNPSSEPSAATSFGSKSLLLGLLVAVLVAVLLV